MVYGFFDDDWTRGHGTPVLQGILLDRPAKKSWKRYQFLRWGYNCRHHVGYGSLWFANDPISLNRWQFEHMQEILASYTGENRPIESYVDLHRLHEKYLNLWKSAYDSVPISRDACKTFLLTKSEKKIEIWDSRGATFFKMGDFSGFTKNPKNEGIRIPSAVSNVEFLDSLFTDDFYAFVRKNPYYFVTESGKLYYAAPPEKGAKSRVMKALWTDAKRPIVAVIEDADRDRVWLFARDKGDSAKGNVYFELKDTIETVSFDRAKLRPVDVEPGRAKTLLEYLPLIRDAKKDIRCPSPQQAGDCLALRQRFQWGILLAVQDQLVVPTLGLPASTGAWHATSSRWLAARVCAAAAEAIGGLAVASEGVVTRFARMPCQIQSGPLTGGGVTS
jgi:hypothetical protein